MYLNRDMEDQLGIQLDLEVQYLQHLTQMVFKIQIILMVLQDQTLQNLQGILLLLVKEILAEL